MVTTFSMGVARELSLTKIENVDKILEIFNADEDCSDSPWDVDILGEPMESAYFLLESKSVWRYLSRSGIDVVRVIECIQPRIESLAIINPNVLDILNSRRVSAPCVDSTPSI